MREGISGEKGARKDGDQNNREKKKANEDENQVEPDSMNSVLDLSFSRLLAVSLL